MQRPSNGRCFGRYCNHYCLSYPVARSARAAESSSRDEGLVDLKARHVQERLSQLQL